MAEKKKSLKNAKQHSNAEDRSLLPRSFHILHSLSFAGLMASLLLFGRLAHIAGSTERGAEDTPETIVVPQSIAGWKNYTSATHTFQIFYPPDWDVESSGDAETLITFRAPTGEAETLRIVDSPLSLDEWTERYTQYPFYRAFPTTVAGRKATEIRQAEGDISYLTIKRGKFYVFETRGLLPQSGILSTLTFIDFYEGWTLYKDEAHHFLFSYPKDWSVATDSPTVTDNQEIVRITVAPPAAEGERPAAALSIYPENFFQTNTGTVKDFSIQDVAGTYAIRFRSEPRKNEERCWYEFPNAPAPGWVGRNRVEIACDPSPDVKHIFETFLFYR